MTNRNFIAILLLTTLSCQQTATKSINVKSLSQDNQTIFQEKIKFTAVADKWDTTNHENNLLVKCQLENSSSDTFSYIIMTCYYPFSFDYVVQPNNILSEVWKGCEANFAEVISIPPKKMLKSVLTLPIKIDLDRTRINSFKIGISLMASKSSYKENEHIEFYDIDNFTTNSTDTIFKIKTKFTLIKNHSITTVDSLGELHVLWSNQIEL